MPSAKINGINVGFELIGDGARAWSLSAFSTRTGTRSLPPWRGGSRRIYRDPDQLIAGLPNDETMAIHTPALVFRSGASDPFHPRETSEPVAAMLPNARVVDPPLGDREWHERQAERPKTGGVCVKWHLLTPQLVDWADEVLASR